jgi:hypothetical protein
VNSLRLVEGHLKTRVHALHPLRQQGLIGRITRLGAMMQVGRREEAFLIRHLINAGLDLCNAHRVKPKLSPLIRKSFPQRRKDLLKSSPAISTTFFSSFDPAISAFSFFS